MGKCLGKSIQINHSEIRKAFDEQIKTKQLKEEQNLKKYNTIGGIIRSSSIKKHSKRNSTIPGFQTKNFIIKNQNNILEEYRYFLYTHNYADCTHQLLEKVLREKFGRLFIIKQRKFGQLKSWIKDKWKCTTFNKFSKRSMF